jgi:hypothetical protein
MATTNHTPLPNQVVLTGAIATGGTITEKGVVCLTQNDMNGTTNTITSDTFCGAEVLPGTIAQTLTVAFRRVWNTDTTEISEAFFYDAWINKSHCQFTVGPLTPATGDLLYKGTGYITAFTNTNAVNAAPLANMTITCDAPFVQSTAP